MTEFDDVVVGGGTAGCIVAARLAEDPAVSVGLIEWVPNRRSRHSSTGDLGHGTTTMWRCRGSDHYGVTSSWFPSRHAARSMVPVHPVVPVRPTVPLRLLLSERPIVPSWCSCAARRLP